MLNKGRTPEELFSFFAAKKQEDRSYDFILSSMCTEPHPVAIQAHCLFMETNLGDPGLFPGTASLEKLLIERFADLFHAPGAGGYATSGGTESNIQALRLAKAIGHAGRKPNVIVPESAHFSFRKACDILSLEMRKTPLSRDFRMDADAAAELIDRNTIALVGVAGTTEYGVVDPIGGLARSQRHTTCSSTSMRPSAGWSSRFWKNRSPSTSRSPASRPSRSIPTRWA